VANVSLTLDAVLTTKPTASNGCGSGGTSGPVFKITLSAQHRSAESQASATVQVIDSPGSFEVLPIPANQRSTVAYLRSLDSSPIMLRLTFESSDPVEIPLAGQDPWLQGFPNDDRLATLAVQGSGRIEWIAAGGIV
jgi:hypothetical protein